MKIKHNKTTTSTDGKSLVTVTVVKTDKPITHAKHVSIKEIKSMIKKP